MLMRYRRSGCLGFALMGLVTVAQADTIHACVQEHSGELRIISEVNHCNPSEHALAWSTGPGRETTSPRTQTPASSEPRNRWNLSDMNLYLE